MKFKTSEKIEKLVTTLYSADVDLVDEKLAIFESSFDSEDYAAEIDGVLRGINIGLQYPNQDFYRVTVDEDFDRHFLFVGTEIEICDKLSAYINEHNIESEGEDSEDEEDDE